MNKFDLNSAYIHKDRGRMISLQFCFKLMATKLFLTEIMVVLKKEY